MDSFETHENNIENKKKKVSFWKHAFNWKYYILPFIVALVIFKAYLDGKNANELLVNFKVINTVIGIVAASLLKSRFLKKVGMFFIVAIFSAIVMNITFFSLKEVFHTVKGESSERQEIINSFLKLNKKVPISIDDESQIIEVSSLDNKILTMYMKYTRYTKDEILAEYDNSISEYEKDILRIELSTSCNTEMIKKILLSGLQLNVEYIGKNNNIVGKISMTNELCKPYYK